MQAVFSPNFHAHLLFQLVAASSVNLWNMLARNCSLELAYCWFHQKREPSCAFIAVLHKWTQDLRTDRSPLVPLPSLLHLLTTLFICNPSRYELGKVGWDAGSIIDRLVPVRNVGFPAIFRKLWLMLFIQPLWSDMLSGVGVFATPQTRWAQFTTTCESLHRG